MKKIFLLFLLFFIFISSTYANVTLTNKEKGYFPKIENYVINKYPNDLIKQK